MGVERSGRCHQPIAAAQSGLTVYATGLLPEAPGRIIQLQGRRVELQRFGDKWQKATVWRLAGFPRLEDQGALEGKFPSLPHSVQRGLSDPAQCHLPVRADSAAACDGGASGAMCRGSSALHKDRHAACRPGEGD